MANYTSSHTGQEIDEAIDKALETEVVSTAEKTDWNSKAAGDHNHDTAYAPISHSEDADIHVTTDDKDYWDSKAEGTHTHTPASIGAAASSHNHSASNITSGTLGVARGGTGRATHTSNYFLRGNGTSAVKLSSPATVLSDIGAMPNSTDFKVTGNLGSFTDQASLNAALDNLTSNNYGWATTIVAQLGIDFMSTEAFGWAAATTVIATGAYNTSQLLMCATGQFFRRQVNGVWGKWQRMCRFKFVSGSYSGGTAFSYQLDGVPQMIIASIVYNSGTSSVTNKTVLLYPGGGSQYLFQTSSQYFRAELGSSGTFYFQHQLTTDVTLNMIEIYG